MEQVGQVVVQRGLAMTVAHPLAQRQPFHSHGNRLLVLAACAADEGQVVERGAAHARIGQRLGARQAQRQMADSLVEVAVVPGQDAQDVVSLSQANGILVDAAASSATCARSAALVFLPLLMRRQAPVGIDSGQSSPIPGGAQAVDRRREVAFRRHPVGAAAVQRGQLVFDAGQGQAAWGRQGRRRLQAVQRRAVLARQGLQIADSFV